MYHYRYQGRTPNTIHLGWMLYPVYGKLGVCCTWCMLYSVNAVLGVCCTWCMLYLVYAVLGVCCTQCMLYIVHAVLSVNSLSWHGEIQRDDLTLCCAMMIVLRTRMREMAMKMRMMWRIRADMRNQQYDLPEWVGKIWYRCNYMPDRDSYLLYRGW